MGGGECPLYRGEVFYYLKSVKKYPKRPFTLVFRDAVIKKIKSLKFSKFGGGGAEFRKFQTMTASLRGP